MVNVGLTASGSPPSIPKDVVPPRRHAVLRKSLSSRTFSLRSGDEIAYLSSGDQFGRIIEDNALDIIADVSPVKDVRNVGQGYHNEATGMS